MFETILGVVLKGPYGAVIFDERSMSQETRVVDVLFGTRVVEKVPVDKLKIVK